ncbi:DUF427 domain-containing protein [Rhizobium ruizarguesonis]
MEWCEDRGIERDDHGRRKPLLPPDSVRKDYLRPSSTTSRCPWKGMAAYYSLEVNGKTNRDAVWYYADPSAAADIKGYLAFWNGVEVG